jgi:hypothetical protein
VTSWERKRLERLHEIVAAGAPLPSLERAMDQTTPSPPGRLASLGGLLSIIHAESMLNQRMWGTYTAIQSVLFALHLPFLIEAKPLLSILAAVVIADLFGGIFHIYCDHSTVRNDGSILDAQRLGFQWHHEQPSGKFEDPAYRPHYEMNYIYPYAILGNLVSFALPTQLRAFVLFFAVFSAIQQASHLWCHARLSNRPVPRIVRYLQDARILLNHRAHEKHHTDPNFDGNFCIFTGHTNALLNVCWRGVRWWQARRA